MYLIALDARTSGVLVSKRHPNHPLRVARTRAVLEKAFPGRLIVSHMESVPKDQLQSDQLILLSVYISRNKEGQGRINGPFESWVIV